VVGSDEMRPDVGPPGGDSLERSFEDRYTDLTEIGRGGYSVVYRAFSPGFNREVAVKVFEGHVTNDDLRRRFQRECQVIGTLGDHPHVVSVFDSGFTAEGQPYLVMAYCGGGSFGQRLAGQGPRPPAEAAVVGIAIADALDAAHERGIVHRDVKPQNVLLTGYGVVALADFGVATGPAGDFRSFAATPGYVAPEVVLGDGTGGPEADVYSVGATMYALLTGGPPIRPDIGETDDAYLIRSAESPVPPLPPGVPAALGRIVLQCLRKEPYNRPSSAAVLRRLLRLAAAEDGLEVPERLEVLPVPASLGPSSPRVGIDRAATTEPTERTGWSRRLAAACLAGGLLAGGVAAGAVLAPGEVRAILGTPDDEHGGTVTAPTGSGGQAQQQRGDADGDGTSTGPGNQPVTRPTVTESGQDEVVLPPGTPGVEPSAGTPTSAPTVTVPTTPPTTETPTKTRKPKKDKPPKPTNSPGPDDAAGQ
jgi:hypothetical protein